MDIFKLTTGKQQVWKINRDNFELATKKQQPWYQSINGHDGFFAVCPACDNPVQLVGMLARGKTKLYGKHFFPQPGTLQYPLHGRVDRDEYLWCPYAQQIRKITKEHRRPVTNPLAITIRETLINQFDRVIYLLEKTTGMGISTALAAAMLEDYRAAQGWLYQGATLQNIPWTFAYMIAAKRLFGRRLLDTEFAAELCRQCPYLHYTERQQILSRNQGNPTFCDLTFCFILHRRRVIENVLEESIVFDVADTSRKTICKKVVQFDHQ